MSAELLRNTIYVKPNFEGVGSHEDMVDGLFVQLANAITLKTQDVGVIEENLDIAMEINPLKKVNWAPDAEGVPRPDEVIYFLKSDIRQ